MIKIDYKAYLPSDVIVDRSKGGFNTVFQWCMDQGILVKVRVRADFCMERTLTLLMGFKAN